MKRLASLLVSLAFTFALSAKTSVIALLGDITKQPVDIIVNAANPQLLKGDGVCGAIFKAAGASQLQKACNDYPIVDSRGVRCPVGMACITPSFNLAKKGISSIIHAVGPDARIITDTTQQKTLLKGAYTSSLLIADRHSVGSIAFPFISSGVYAVDHHLASQAAVEAVQEYLQGETNLQEIRFVLFSQKDLALFNALLQGTNV